MSTERDAGRPAQRAAAAESPPTEPAATASDGRVAAGPHRAAAEREAAFVEAASREAAKPPRSDRAKRLAERRARHRERSRPYRIVVVIVGFLITLAGVVMTGPVPGPGFLVIPIGLALLALEFDWAARLLERALDYAEAQKRKAAQATRTQKILSVVATVLAIAAFVTAAILWDIPLLPV